MLRAAVLFALAALFAPAAQAQIRVSDTLAATQACPATTAIRSSDSSVTLQPGQRYQVVAKNRPDATHLQVLVDGQRRWVALACGTLAGGGGGPAPADNARASYVLAMSWEPAFCRAHADRPECAPGQPGAAGRQLSLHGFWPQPRGNAYCNVADDLKSADRAHRWERLPEPDIAPGTRQRLASQMPGLESGLERHEWIVHGTCSGLTADAYFARAADLSAQVNATALPAFFAQNQGRDLTAAAIRAAVDQAVGPGAGARVLISCPGRTIQELDISLAGDVTGRAPLATLMLAAAPVSPGCPVGRVAAP